MNGPPLSLAQGIAVSAIGVAVLLFVLRRAFFFVVEWIWPASCPCGGRARLFSRLRTDVGYIYRCDVCWKLLSVDELRRDADGLAPPDSSPPRRRPKGGAL